MNNADEKVTIQKGKTAMLNCPLSNDEKRIVSIKLNLFWDPYTIEELFPLWYIIECKPSVVIYCLPGQAIRMTSNNNSLYIRADAFKPSRCRMYIVLSLFDLTGNRWQHLINLPSLIIISSMLISFMLGIKCKIVFHFLKWKCLLLTWSKFSVQCSLMHLSKISRI